MPITEISRQVRDQIVAQVERAGWEVQLRKDGRDRYVKVLMFVSRRTGDTLYIPRQGMSVDGGGMPKYFRVVIHPDAAQPDCLDSENGITQARNRKTGSEYFASSNYQAFPVREGADEPAGICYDARDLEALGRLLDCLSERKSHATAETEPAATAQASESSGMPITDPQAHIPAQVVQRAESRTSTLATRPEGVLKSGLVIDSPHIERILEGEKIWEMRSSRTATRGWIALIRKGSGTVVGVTRIVDVLGPLSLDERLAALDKHRIDEAQLRSGEVEKWVYAWVLEEAQPLPRPVAYQHRSGAVIWVTLDEPVIEAICAQVKGLQPGNGVNTFIPNAGFKFPEASEIDADT
ncbi:uncharacterized protein FOKN1_1352 [Thiohalobacter thiocyanaticus]|uniref:ASCH domain-containing protein n=1 Tax=Thiohalobacter thiocyanaticus TaxID=585455 RepID=A0A1Z4VQ31_9GAMM|nr:hypothetical protein [Thiohalobacter thiocyanaticus]BAZ93750.1 uncharacterized protein FOKN1_1352 [Thiohalobacter thiocyanaticus]